MLGQNKRSQFDPVERISAIRKQAVANRGPTAVDLPGPAPNTAGPHRQDLLNKLDPTVDSMDGGTQILGSGINSRNQQGTTMTTTTTTKHNGPNTTTIPGKQGTTAIPRDQQHAQPTYAIPRDRQNDLASTMNKEASSVGAGGAANHHQATARGGPSAGQVHKSRMANEVDPRISTGPGGAAIPKQSAGYAQPSHGFTGGAYNQEQLNAPSDVSQESGRSFGPIGGSRTHEQSNMPVDTSQVSRRPVGSTDGAYSHQSNAPFGGSHVSGRPVGSTGGAYTHQSNMPIGSSYGSERRLDSNGGAHAHHANKSAGTTHGSGRPSGPYGEAYTGEQSDMSIGGSPRSERPVGRTDGAYTHQSNMPVGGSQASERATVLANEYGPQAYTAAGDDAVPRGSNYMATGARTTNVHEGPEVHPGPASKTAGPHSNNWLNKLDPRVDSKATVIDRREYRTS